jgi:signal transduction histidine kinase/FixJ family two-component response regulator
MKKPLRVLIVEDSEDDVLLLLREIRKGGYDAVFERVETAESMKEALGKGKWDIIISDYMLPKFSGLAALSVLKETGLDLPFIIVSGKIGEDIAVDAMKSGAHDYVMKGNLKRLVPAVERELREAEIRRERKNALEAIKTERQRFYALLEMLPAYLVLLTPDYHVAFANRFFRARFGEPQGRPCFEYLFGRSKPCETCEPHAVLKTIAPHHWEWAGPDGHYYDVHDFPFTDADGSTLILEMGIDITERKQAENETKAHMTRLEALNQELQEFTFAASHDLQEPLRKIQTFGDILKARCEGSLGEQGRHYIEKMLNTTTRMRALLDGLLKYSMVTTNAIRFAPVDLGKAVQEVIADLAILIEETGGAIEVSNLPALESDETLLRQLFQNLISNALKYHGQEKPIIKIYSLSCVDGFCDVFVEDNGIGFEEMYVDRIFRPFQRLHGHGSPYEGTGMGLAICRKIVERHGGSITARSNPGKGSTFIVTLPLRQTGRSA